MEQKVIDFSKLGPDLSRFSLKAKSLCGCWLYAQLSCNSRGEWGLFWTCPMDQPNAMFELNPETFCRCTGLRDSDGKLIYENDYLKITGKEGNIEKALVRYDENILEYLLIFNKSELPIRFFLIWMEEGKKCYVVGNKFDKEEDNEP